jgi:hypothetical protein
MRKLLALALVIFCPTVFAEDGLTVQFTISEQAAGSDRTQSYTNAILMRFDEEVSFDLNDMYVLKIRSRTISDSQLNLLVTLKDVVDGKPYYVGASPVDVKVGDSATIELTRENISYVLNLDTSYGTIPQE